MIYQIAIPITVEDTKEIRVLEWHGTAGRHFEPGDLIVEVETHKVVIEIRAGQAGVLRAILCAEGQWQKLGTALALFSDAADEALPAGTAAGADLLVEFDIA